MMKIDKCRYQLGLAMASFLFVAACGDSDSQQSVQDDRPPRGSIETSGKRAIGTGAVPPEVLQAAVNVRPELQIEAAEHETRMGRDYYDLAGKMPDGSELELGAHCITT